MSRCSSSSLIRRFVHSSFLLRSCSLCSASRWRISCCCWRSLSFSISSAFSRCCSISACLSRSVSISCCLIRSSSSLCFWSRASLALSCSSCKAFLLRSSSVRPDSKFSFLLSSNDFDVSMSVTGGAFAPDTAGSTPTESLVVSLGPFLLSMV